MTEKEAEKLITTHLVDLDQMFPPFTPGIIGFSIDMNKDFLHLKGKETILSMPLSKVIEHFQRTNK